jgi:hypothetical protein
LAFELGSYNISYPSFLKNTANDENVVGEKKGTSEIYTRRTASIGKCQSNIITI